MHGSSSRHSLVQADRSLAARVLKSDDVAAAAWQKSVSHSGHDADAVQWWVEAASTNIFEDALPPVGVANAAAGVIDLQMMAGETEHRQIVVRLPISATTPVRDVALSFSPLVRDTAAAPASSSSPGSPSDTAVATKISIPPSALRWRQQGFVNCSKFFYATMRPAPGMFPDPLWEPADGEAALWPGVTASFWASVALPPSTAAGNYSGSVSLTSAAGLTLVSVPLRLEVWPIVLPPLAQARFSAVMSWIDDGDFSSADGMGKLMAPAGGREAYWSWMCEHRMAPNKLYVAPAFNFHAAANGSGARSLQLLTNTSVNGSIAKSCGARGGARSVRLLSRLALCGAHS